MTSIQDIKIGLSLTALEPGLVVGVIEANPAATPTGNSFEDLDHLIVRPDQMVRHEDLQEKLCAAGWDLVLFDEERRGEANFAWRSSRRASLGAIRLSKFRFRNFPAARRTPTHRRSFAIR